MVWVSGTLKITIGRTPPRWRRRAGVLHERGRMHGFRNTGLTPAAVFEILFVKRSTTAAAVMQERDVENCCSPASAS